MNDRLRQMCRAFAERFGIPPQWGAEAPGRVNVIGEHVDYNDGFVLPMAIDRSTCLLAAPAPDSGAASPSWTIYSESLGQTATIRRTSAVEPEWGWARYLQGVWTLGEAAGLATPSLNVLIHSTVPVGSGLSSSAALEVATATLLEQVSGRRMEPLEKIRLCQRAEHEYAGVPCGIMDQYASVAGRAGKLLLLDCRTLVATHVTLPTANWMWLIANTHVQHALGGTEYAVRRSQCEAACRHLGVASLRDVDGPKLESRAAGMDPVVFRRARHVVREIDRTQRAVEALGRGDARAAGLLMYASHESLRDDYEVSCPELDTLVATARTLGEGAGVWGSRMTGGGFGGCTISLIERAACDNIMTSLRESFQAAHGHAPSFFVTEPAEGAHSLPCTT